MKHNNLRVSKEYIIFKIDLKDMLNNFCNILHLKNKDFENLFTVGIHAICNFF